MVRELTQFEMGVRSDVLPGRGGRWAISTPQDELEKFRFFVQQIEELINQAEEREIKSLKQSVTGLSEEAQDEFWQYYYPVHWDEIFRTTSRNSMVVLERARKYLVAIGKFKRPSSAKWDRIDVFFRIRHVIVHVGGLTLGSNHQKAIELFSKGRRDLRIEHRSIEVEPAFLEFLIHQLNEFILELESEFRMLCEEMRRIEL